MNARLCVAGFLTLAGALNLAFPGYFISKAYPLALNPAANFWLIPALGIALIATAYAVAAEPQEDARPVRSMTLGVGAGLAILYFIVLGQHLKLWWIDDAGITFAYSRSLADGLGLVAQPWLPPQEGYSSSVWMLLLSAMAHLGMEIPLAAKMLGTVMSATAMALCAWVLARETRSPLAIAVCCIGIAAAPTVVWAVSGQEHALQSLLLLGVTVCAWRFEAWRWPAAAVLSVLVLTRPEAPIIVIAVFIAAVCLTRRAGGRLINAGDIAVALVPFAAFVALMGFRLTYFGDLFPNPYYAKSSVASLTGLVNLMGGGWAYILSGLRDTALLIVLPLVLLIRFKPLPDWVIVAMAVVAGHVIFVIWAKGDWMEQYRFLMPLLPLAMLLASLGLQGLPGQRLRMVFGLVAILVLVQATLLQLTDFKARPTTPLATVTTVGETFRRLSERLQIGDPLLAHHDAGGIAYRRMIRLVDLGGLIDRDIAKNMDNKAFLTGYLLDEKQPDFFFGARNFAAASGFAETERFARDYVSLEFVAQPIMRSDLSYIRRSRVVEAPGIELVRDATGRLIRVRVLPDS